jgi:hypothetical protein
MADNKNNPDTNTKTTSGNDNNRAFESQGKNNEPGVGQQGQQTASQKKNEDDDMTTAGGRKGQFSDSERGKEGQWSPGSGHASDQ